MEVNDQMDRNTIARHVMEAIQVCMEAGGKECPQITGETVPLKDIRGFDSLCAIEVLVDLESKLGKELGEDIFVDDSRKAPKPRSVSEVVEAILESKKPAKKGVREKHA